MKITIDRALQKGLKAHQAGNIQEADKYYTAILKVQPDNPDANHNMGLLAVDIGKIGEALPFFKASLTANPNVERFWISYIEAHIRLNKVAEAKHLFDIAKGKGFDGDNFFYFKQKLDGIFENDATNRLIEGNKFYNEGNFERAIKKYEHAIRINPEYAEAYFNKANALVEYRGDALSAIESYRKAIEIRPDYIKAHNNLGNILKDIGDQDPAKKEYKTALKINPQYATAHFNLSKLKTYKIKDRQLSIMEKLCRETTTQTDDKCILNFALSKAYEDLGNLNKSYQLLKQGNTLRKQILSYEICRDEQLFEEIKSASKALYDVSLKKKTVSEVDLVPILIVGMPRSGTTLIEQIISSHSSVTGGGELNFVDLYGRNLVTAKVTPTQKKLNNFRNQYLSVIRRAADGTPFITDKMPHNFLYLGLVCSSLPEAKIVHVQRDPRATCWSNYKHFFPSRSIGYCYDLNDLVQYYRMYQEIIKYWEGLYPDRIFSINYDDLTNNQETETKKLISHLDLVWEKDCLYPHRNKRFVRSASSQQVREKVYQNSSKKWLKFQNFIGGAFDSLIKEN